MYEIHGHNLYKQEVDTAKYLVYWVIIHMKYTYLPDEKDQFLQSFYTQKLATVMVEQS